ncbi:undecaprenyl-diphosphate phosphatase [Paenibacillus sp.]|uniref:undecaprenyl-diphosphate phosphatase n=1 Tax=Paenibacillus sp. TaxID=58172 RepID=UPI002D371BA0|nr:undecaprenyl-diphosphate phosphatase [Paenibacillus sp.]HZG56283.1 undecaprenyl-diphosphate phosphatase [Paenibacillus sp.]
MDIFTVLKAILLGLVEGLTEFAPVSSTGHMIIVDDMWLKSKTFLTPPVANTFKVVIQLGSILAVVVMFRRRFVELLGLDRLAGGGAGERAAGGPRLKLGQVIVGLLPAGVLGVLTEDFIDNHLFTTETVLVGLVLGALLMIAADRLRPKTPSTETVDRLTYKQALTVGLVQCFSLWPGFSRSGATISAGVLAGMSHKAAADFTFIMAVPIMAGASLISFVKNFDDFTVAAIPFFVAGFVSAFVFAMISIRYFLKLIDRVKLVPFAIYRLALAAVIAWVYFF